jgi:hypothetical protein
LSYWLIGFRAAKIRHRVDDAKNAEASSRSRKRQENTIGAICVFFDCAGNDAPADLLSFSFRNFETREASLLPKKLLLSIEIDIGLPVRELTSRSCRQLRNRLPHNRLILSKK